MHDMANAHSTAIRTTKNAFPTLLCGEGVVSECGKWVLYEGIIKGMTEVYDNTVYCREG